MKKLLPSHLQPKLWSSHLKSLDIIKDRHLITHKILSYGDLGDMRLLFKLYKLSDIRETFLSKPMKLYTKPGVNFVKSFILNLEKTPINDSNYVKTLY